MQEIVSKIMINNEYNNTIIGDRISHCNSQNWPTTHKTKYLLPSLLPQKLLPYCILYL